MRRKILYILILMFIFVFLGKVDVNAAALNMKDITLECIYSDGGLYTSEYSIGLSDDGEEKEEFTINRTAYPLQGAPNSESNQGANSLYINSLANGNKCHKKLLTAIDSEDESKGTRYYKFIENGGKFVKEDFNLDSNWWCLIFGCGAVEQLGSITNSMQTYSLISERYIFKSDTPDPDAAIYYVKEVKEELKQAAGVNQYISILVYGNDILMKKNDRITRLEGDYSDFIGVTRDDKTNELSKELPATIYINSPEPKQSTTSSSTVNYSFKSGQTVFSVSKKDDSIHTEKYTLTDLLECGEGETRGSDGRCESDISDALCNEILPNTSVQLKKVIKWSQILVPILLIVLTALDIGRIVISGNIEEELPKRKKIITIRFVVVIIFFFLPVFVRLITGWLINSGAENTKNIQYIDCLFK